MTNAIAIIDPAGVTSDESFAPLTNTAPTLMGDSGIGQLESDILAVRQLFDANTVEDAEASDKAEARYAALLARGYQNALDLLAHKDVLRTLLAKSGITAMAKDDHSLLGQIATLQLGRWEQRKDKGAMFVVPSRRNERLARFYRIFFTDRATWKVEGLEDAILAHKGKSTGIINAAKEKKRVVSKKEKDANLKAARKAKGLGEAKLPDVNVGKLGEYQLILARVTPAGFEVCEVVKGRDTLKQAIIDEWAAEASMTVIAE